MHARSLQYSIHASSPERLELQKLVIDQVMKDLNGKMDNNWRAIGSLAPNRAFINIGEILIQQSAQPNLQRSPGVKNIGGTLFGGSSLDRQNAKFNLSPIFPLIYLCICTVLSTVLSGRVHQFFAQMHEFYSHKLTGIFLPNLDHGFITSTRIFRSTLYFIGYTTVFL